MLKTASAFIVLFLGLAGITTAQSCETGATMSISPNFQLIAKALNPTANSSLPIDNTILSAFHISPQENYAVLLDPSEDPSGGRVFFINGTNEDANGRKTTVGFERGTAPPGWVFIPTSKQEEQRTVRLNSLGPATKNLFFGKGPNGDGVVRLKHRGGRFIAANVPLGPNLEPYRVLQFRGQGQESGTEARVLLVPKCVFGATAREGARNVRCYCHPEGLNASGF